jgi:hypothetical protein
LGIAGKIWKKGKRVANKYWKKFTSSTTYNNGKYIGKLLRKGVGDTATILANSHPVRILSAAPLGVFQFARIRIHAGIQRDDTTNFLHYSEIQASAPLNPNNNQPPGMEAVLQYQKTHGGFGTPMVFEKYGIGEPYSRISDKVNEINKAAINAGVQVKIEKKIFKVRLPYSAVARLAESWGQSFLLESKTKEIKDRSGGKGSKGWVNIYYIRATFS